MNLRSIRTLVVGPVALALFAFVAPARAAVVVSTDNATSKLAVTASDSESDVISITATPDVLGPDHYTVTDSEGVTTTDGDCPTVNGPNEIVCNLDAARIEVDAGPGGDRITIGTGKPLDTVPATLIGGDGNDFLTGGPAADDIEGGGGDDSPSEYYYDYGGSAPCSDFQGAFAGGLYGGDGDDRITGGAGVDRLEGGPGSDVLDGGNDAEAPSITRFDGFCIGTLGGLYGGIGNDELLAFDGVPDRVYCGADTDSYVSDPGVDSLFECETNADSDADGIPADADSCPTLAGNTASGCPPAARSLTLGYSTTKRTFKGKITSISPQCIGNIVVTVIKERSSGDVEIGQATTGPTGSYKLRKRARRGKYHASVDVDVAADVAECVSAVSPTKRVR